MNKALAITIALLAGGLFALPLSAKMHNDNKAVLKSYETVSTALANDDLPAAKTAATDLAEKAKAAGNRTLQEHAAELAKSDSLATAREHFKAMSGEAAKLAKGSDQFHMMHCPMAKADWAQSGDKVMNPYLGKKMQQCGTMMNGMMKDRTGANASAAGCCSTMG